MEYVIRLYTATNETGYGVDTATLIDDIAVPHYTQHEVIEALKEELCVDGNGDFSWDFKDVALPESIVARIRNSQHQDTASTAENLPKGVSVTIVRTRMDDRGKVESYVDGPFVYVGPERSEDKILEKLVGAIRLHLIGADGDRDLSYASGDFNWGDGMTCLSDEELAAAGFHDGDTPFVSDYPSVTISVDQDAWPMSNLDIPARLVVVRANGEKVIACAGLDVDLRDGYVEVFDEDVLSFVEADDRVYLEFCENGTLHPMRWSGTTHPKDVIVHYE